MRKIVLLIYFLGVISAYAQAPVFSWAKSMGGSSNEGSRKIALDASGNIYTTGFFMGTSDFDPGPGIFNLTSNAWEDMYISKLDAAGNFLWARNIGGAMDDGGLSIAADLFGNTYITGWFNQTVDFDPGPSIFNLTAPGSAGNAQIFILKLDPSGNFVWAKQMGGSGEDGAWDIAIDAFGNIYTTGRFSGTADFDPGTGVFNLISSGMDDIFISKLNSGGNFVWAKNLGSSQNDYGYSLALDAFSNVYTIGAFKDTADFDPGPGIFNLTSAGGNDVFISKLNASGNFVWAKGMGGTGVDNGSSVAIDLWGNVYTISNFEGLVDFDPGAGIFNLNAGINTDICISKLNASGNFLWAKDIGGTSLTFGASITTDLIGNIYTTGWFNDTVDFDPGAGTYNLTAPGPAGNSQVFILKLNSSGNFEWVQDIGGNQYDGGYSITVDAWDNVFTTGTYKGIGDFDPGPGTFNLTSVGYEDIFIQKLSQYKSVGINEKQEATVITIFPNPSSGIFTIHFSNDQNMKIYMYDLLGNCISNKIYGNNENIKIDLSSQSKGIYFVEIISQGQTINKKIVLD